MSDPLPPFSARQLAEQVLAFREANAPDKHRFSEHALIVDNGRRGSEQKAVIFTGDDLSALLMDLRDAEQTVSRLRELLRSIRFDKGMLVADHASAIDAALGSDYDYYGPGGNNGPR